MNIPCTATREKSSWRILYPPDCMRYIEAFRRHYWDHHGVCALLHDFFTARGGVKVVCELGSGAGTNLEHLDDYGYECHGYELNVEALAIARARSAQSGRRIEFTQLDFSSALPARQFDALISLFVPISLDDMRSLALRAHDIIRPGGYFVCMLLVVLPEYAHVAEHDASTLEFLEVENTGVVRMNFFRKRGHQIEFDGVYLAHEQGGLRMFHDRDRYDLLESLDTPLRLPEDRFEHVQRLRVQGRKDQCPPMTCEILDIFRTI